MIGIDVSPKKRHEKLINQHMKRCSPSLVSEMQKQNHNQIYFTSTKTALIKRQTTNAGKDAEKRDLHS